MDFMFPTSKTQILDFSRPSQTFHSWGTWAPVHQPGAKLHTGHAHHPCQVDFHEGPGPPGVKLPGPINFKNQLPRFPEVPTIHPVIWWFQRLSTVGVRNPNVSYETNCLDCLVGSGENDLVDGLNDKSESNHPRNGHCSFPRGGCIL